MDREADRSGGENRGMILQGQYRKGRISYGTPQALVDDLDNEFHFTLDACAEHHNAKCLRYFTIEDDALNQSWAGEIVFMNPPQAGQTETWMAKAFQESLNGAIVVCLVPSYTGTRWWHEYAMKGEIRFIRGKLRFDNQKYQAPFYSAIVIFRLGKC